MRAVAVIGNPKVGSCTADAAMRLAEALGATDVEQVELAELGAQLLAWGEPLVSEAVGKVKAAPFVIFASPTFKATYTGLLKLFLEQFDSGTGLEGVVALPLMLGASPQHAMAPELSLKPVLSEIGATCALPGLYLIDREYADGVEIDRYASSWAATLRQLT